MLKSDHLARIRFGVDYRQANPYQTLVYRSAGPAIEARPASVAEAVAEEAEGAYPVIYHLHWEEHDVRFGTEAERRARMQALLDGLDALRARGDHVVWTRHNLRPHDPAIGSMHEEMVRHLDALASVVHVHSWPALEAIRSRDPLDLSKTVVIAHGNFVAHYPEWAGPAARRRLGLPPDAFVFLLFGRLDGYKQAETLATALAGIDDPDARLMLVGTGRNPLALGPVGDDLRLILVERFVPEAEVGLFHAAADCVVLPYSFALTSGAGMLAASLGKGVVGPDVPGLREIVIPGASGLLYDPAAPDALAGTLRRALREGRETWAERGARAQASALCRDWMVPGRQWRDLFLGLAARPRRGNLTLARLALG